MATYSTDRVADGRWCVVMTPCPGILYTDDDQVLGFAANAKVGGTVYDPTSILEQIAVNYAAGITASHAFDLIAANTGTQIDEGDLRTWRKSRMRLRPDVGVVPEVSAAEVKAATRMES